jgi:NhaP-type Na+/H+ and K+/H+ antiporter
MRPMTDVPLKLAVVAAGGIAAQWIAWRVNLPAIVLLLVTGFLIGPLTGFIDPATDFGEVYRPVVSMAAVIAANALTNLILEEAGLLTVTVMGLRLANSRIASLAEIRRFKECSPERSGRGSLRPDEQ